MSTSTTTLPTSLAGALPVVSVSAIDSVGSMMWSDDSGNLVTVKGTREVLRDWVRRIRGVVVTEDNSYDATNVGPQT
jgi:hypothetical protein